MKKKHSFQHTGGFSLIEMMVVVLIVAIPLLAVGILSASGSRSFHQVYDSIHKDIKEDAMATIVAFGNLGRKSNRSNYKVFQVKNGTCTEAQPAFGQDIAYGQAVEFRYWDQPFNPQNPGADVLEVTNTGTHYALLYLDGNELKLDFGKVAGGNGAVVGNVRTTSNLIQTVVLARNVDLSAITDIFSHNVIGGVGAGSVRLNIVLTDQDGESVEIKTSTLLRLNWPR